MTDGNLLISLGAFYEHYYRRNVEFPNNLRYFRACEALRRAIEAWPRSRDAARYWALNAERILNQQRSTPT